MRPRTLLWLALVTLGLGASLARAGSAAIFTKQTENTGNTFTTAASFATDTPTATPTSTPTATPSPTPTPTPSCAAGDTGFLNPSAQAADPHDGNGFEVDPTNAYEDDSSFAVNVEGAGDQHRYYNYGVSIPSGCSVKGIELRLDWWLQSTTGTNSMSVELSWDGGTSWAAAKTDSTETTSEHTAVLGGGTDTWGRTWTPDELSDANFRARVTSDSDQSWMDFYLEWVPVKVYYSGGYGEGYGAAYGAAPATSTPTPSATPTPTPALTVTRSPTATPTPELTVTPSPTATPTPTPAITPTPFSYPFAVPTPTPFSYPFAVPTPTPAAEATPTAPLTATPTPAPSCTAMPTPTVTPTPAPSCTDMPTPIVTPTPTATPTPS